MNYEEIINVLNSDNYYTLKNDIVKFANDNSFLNKIIKVHNPFIFDRFIKMCEFKMDTSLIHEERNKFIKKSIDEINEENIYHFYELEGLEKSRQNHISSRYLSEYIINYYFQDNFYNFMTNFYQMAHYLYNDKEKLVSLEHLKLYEQFVNVTKLSLEEKKKLFYSNLNKNLMEMFYDDMNIVRSDSHKELVNHALKLNKENGIYQPDLTRRFRIDTYYLDGEEFYGFIRCLHIKSNDLSDNFDYVYSKKSRLGYSFSYISNNNIGTSDYDGKNVTLFYDNIDYKNIMYVHHADMYTKKTNMQDEYLSVKENEIFTPSSLISHTVNYNEVFIKGNEEGIKPTALVCYDRISNNDLAFATKYDLAILIINTKKYKRYETYDEDYDSHSYIL